MKRFFMALGALGLILAAAFSAGAKKPRPDFDFKKNDHNPVSHFKFNSDPAEFQFAIVSDRTGGHRARIFSRAVEQLNLLQPEFVLSVGDLIEGYTESTERLAKEWREFQGYVARLQMPFFYVPGNHDLANLVEDKLWTEKFGRSYYSFLYREVLFLILNSEDPPGQDDGRISEAQLAFIKKTLDEHREARWTFVLLHKPMWTAKEPAKTGWLEVEKLLGERRCTIFAGHIHRYQKFIRDSRNYYQLATTGGASKTRGIGYGEFDHIVWVTMKQDGPLLANLLMDGIISEDLRQIETAETGAPVYNRRPTHPVRGRVFYDGKPVQQAYVALNYAAKETDPPHADAFTESDGTFTLTTYTAGDGAPVGEYIVTVEWRRPLYDESGRPGPNLLPARYADRQKSPLKVRIVKDQNHLVLNLEK